MHQTLRVSNKGIAKRTPHEAMQTTGMGGKRVLVVSGGITHKGAAKKAPLREKAFGC